MDLRFIKTMTFVGSSNLSLKFYTDIGIRKFKFVDKTPFISNRLSSTIGGNRELNQLYTTSQVSNITRKTKLSHVS